MKKFHLCFFNIFLLTGIVNISLSQNMNVMDSPLLQAWNTPFETPPFNKIEGSQYLPAVKYAISQAKLDVNNIINNPLTPDFENTIEALEQSGMLLNRINSLFFNMLEADATPEMQKLAYEIDPLVMQFYNDVNLDPMLFEKVKYVYDHKNNDSLNIEQQMLLDKTYRSFIRRGAALSDSNKIIYREISEKISELSMKFNENVLNATNAFKLHITDEKSLSGLPDYIVESAAKAAADEGQEGWVFSLSMPVYVAVMKYCDDRSIRKQMYYAYNSRCFNNDQFSNRKIVVDIANLRLKLANLLGYKCYSDYVLEERMAQTTEKVNSFLNALTDSVITFAEQDRNQLNEFAIRQGFNFDFMRWDWSYYSEKLASQLYQIDDQKLKPYFSLDKVKNGVFELCYKLYGLKFIKSNNIQVYNQAVEAYEVYGEDQRFLAVLYLDFFPRKSKRNGAWMTTFRDQYRMDGKDVRPLVQLVFNFTEPGEKQPSLLTFNEVTTFLHEFGHALHAILSDVQYASLSGTNVYRDFVELPSQLMENYAVHKEFLNLFAYHYQNGDRIPEEIVVKLKDYENFQSGYAFLRQLTFAKLDMAWHTIQSPVEGDPGSFENKVISALSLLPEVNNTNISVQFSHIFNSGYAVGYYGYKWAEVLDADAFSIFEKNGIFDKTTAASFRENILSKGGSEHPMKLFVRFRGQEPSVDALLKRSGLQKK